MSITKTTDIHNNLIEFDPKAKYQRYKVNGEPKKGVTSTIGKRFAGGGLMFWKQNVVFEALRQTLKKQGQPVDMIQQLEDAVKARTKEIESDAANIGTNFHLIASDYITGKEVVTPQTEPLKTMFEKFKMFWDKQSFKVIESEKTIYSKQLDSAGTCDLVVTKDTWTENDKPLYALMDFKTSKDYYVDYVIQEHTYKKLFEDSTNMKISKLAIINVPKEPSKDVEIRYFKISNKYLKAFRACQYLDKIEADFASRTKEWKKQLMKRRANVQ